MERQIQKTHKTLFFTVTSDAENAEAKQFRISSRMLWVFVLLICILIGALIGFVCYESKAIKDRKAYLTMHSQEMEKLEQERTVLEQKNIALESEVAEKDELIYVLSEAVNQKTQMENQLTEQIEKQAIPTEFPLTGSATMEEVSGENLTCVFLATEGAMVIATANGTVTAVNNDVEYGYNVWVDHGNGYVTIYRNAGEVKVKQGEAVTAGTTLILTDENSRKLGYQMMKNNEYIDPMEMIEISG